MKTAYIIKSPARYVSFDCQPNTGLTFITSTMDITYLNNVLINGDLKLFIQQDIHEHGVGIPNVWFLIFSNAPMNNVDLEKAWKYAVETGALLNRYTQLGQSFSYEHIWAFPNVPDEWLIEQTLVQFKGKDGIQGIYWDDPRKPTYVEDGELLRESTIHAVNADLVAVIQSDERLTQSHFVHISLPGNSNIDTKGFDQRKNVLEEIKAKGFQIDSVTVLYLLTLFNRAISSQDIFQSNITLFQMVEVIIGITSGTKIANAAKSRLKTFLESDLELSKFSDRLINATGNIPLETSKELLEKGIEQLVGSKNAKNLNLSDFSKWRQIRGALTHPKEAKALTETDFVATYKSLRSFCTAVVKHLHEQ